MPEVRIKKSEFIDDYENLSVEEVKQKYGLNNRSFYKIVDQLKLERKRKGSTHKKIILLEE